MVITSTEPSPFEADPTLVNDDLKRELVFYEQALSAVKAAKILCEKEKIPFNRPDDYFAEMVKSDSHMQKVRQALVDESNNIKKSLEAKLLRQQKKFGKKVQVEKIKERHASKKAELEKVMVLKKKSTSNNLDDPVTDKKRKRTVEDEFDVSVSDEKVAKSSEKRSDKSANRSVSKKQRKDEKFGFGGKKRNSKSNTAESTDMQVSRKKGGFNNQKKTPIGQRKSPSKKARPGKARRSGNRK